MKHREVWSEENFKFGRIDPTPWIPFNKPEYPGFWIRLWRWLTK